jgi:nucleoside-diphosphate-sugar epimerase
LQVHAAIRANPVSPKKARSKLTWQPRVSFDELVALMVESDLELARKEQVLLAAGHDASVPNR